MTRFTRFACFDWSGQNIARPRGIALAIAGPDGAPRLVDRPGGWSRGDVLDWLRALAGSGDDMLVGFDFSPALPFADAGAYFPGWPATPPDARALWATIDRMAATDLHLGCTSFLQNTQIARYFRQSGGRAGDLFGPRGRGRLRVTEARGGGAPASGFNLIGASQVGKSSLTGMRVLHQLAGGIPCWPFDPLPDRGPALVEIYTSIAARAAGAPPGRSKFRTRDALDRALAVLGTPPVVLPRYDDHATDAVVTAAWLARHAGDETLWHPDGLAAVAQTEGWTFGVR